MNNQPMSPRACGGGLSLASASGSLPDLVLMGMARVARLGMRFCFVPLHLAYPTDWPRKSQPSFLFATRGNSLPIERISQRTCPNLLFTAKMAQPQEVMKVHELGE